MHIIMQKVECLTLEQMREFLAASEELVFTLSGRGEIYNLVERTLGRQQYLGLPKKDKGVVRHYLSKLSGTQSAADHSPDSAVSPKRRGAAAAAAAAAFPHPLHARRHRLAGSGRRGARRALGPGGAAHSVAGILRLPQGGLSAAGLDLFLPHLQLAARAAYRQHHVHHTKTRARAVSIGERRKPDHRGRPGYLRVDTVHQGDTSTRRGLHHINAVDALTQWQIVGCCQTISESHLIPVLEAMLHQYPFRIEGFHSDNGSEFINYRVENC